MKILIEEHQYRTDLVKPILSGLYTPSEIEKTVQINYVGYYYNPTLKDCVFILPKVLLDENDKAFGKYNPDDLIDLEENEKLEEDRKLTDREKNFIYELAVWVYRAIVVYNEKKKKNNIVKRWNVSKMGHGRLHMCSTFLDIILAILKFNRENQDFIFFILRNLHSGYNKINWTRTISHSEAIIQNDSPIYLNPVNKKRQINFDEELLVIFFSILNYIQNKYGFPVILNVNIPLITGKKFDNYLNGMGVVRLRQIKYKYFSDKALYLWDLCFAFFEKSKKIIVETDDKEYLIVKDFQIVFEAIIDELIGAKEEDIPKGLKEQKDGKRVDHMFFDDGLIENDEFKPVYYIGDSKYYKRGTNLNKTSVYKQFTYAKNVIQWNLDLFLDEDEDDKDLSEDKRKFKDTGRVRKLRDDETEGYNIIPNFFISAKQDVLEMSSEITSTDKAKDQFLSRQFYNRLFDRDTLLISHYDVNFLYVISLYGRNKESEKSKWGKNVRKVFREKIQEILDKQFQFHIMTPLEHVDGQKVLQENFKEVLGKVFKPYPNSPSGQQFYSLALERPEKIEDEEWRKKVQEENKRVNDLLKPYFDIVECKLGEDKRQKLIKYTPTIVSSTKNGLLMVMMENYDVKSKSFLPSGKIAIGIKYTKDSMEIVEHLASIGFVLFHHRNTFGQHLFAVKGNCKVVSREEVEEGRYKNVNTTHIYLVVDIDTSVELDATKLDSTKKEWVKETRYDAQFAFINDLLLQKEVITEHA